MEEVINVRRKKEIDLKMAEANRCAGSLNRIIKS